MRSVWSGVGAGLVLAGACGGEGPATGGGTTTEHAGGTTVAPGSTTEGPTGGASGGASTSGPSPTTGEATGAGTTAAGSSTGASGVCGDGVQDAGEACDDGDADDGDDCTSACALAACGDGQVWVGVEGCDDGNVRGGDGCSAGCEPEGAPDLYLASALSDFGFHGYHIAADAWVTLPGPPSISYSQLTNDGERVYLLGIDDTIYEYSPSEEAWTASAIPGPGAEPANTPVGFFKWTDQGFYYLRSSLTTLYHFKDGAWAPIALPNVGSCAGAWVPARDELFIRSYQQTGFMVLRTLDDAVVRSITDLAPLSEPGRTAAVSGSFFYVRGMFGPLERLDVAQGMKTSTGRFPESPQTAADTDVATGSIYLAGYQSQARIFQRYDPGPNTITRLADAPEVPDLSTITVMLPR